MLRTILEHRTKKRIHDAPCFSLDQRWELSGSDKSSDALGVHALTLAIVLAGLLISAGSTLAAGSDDGFAAFWTQFKAAVGKGDQKTVSRMIKYPILYMDLRQVTDFPVIWKGAFTPAQRTCLAKQKPGKDTNEGKVSYSAFCGELIYVFGKDDAGWKLTDFAVND